MLSTIRDMINRKESFQEAAAAILEDGYSAIDLDDLIVLGEETDEPEPDEEPEEDAPEAEDNGSEEGGEEINNDIPEVNEDETDSDPMNDTIDDGGDTAGMGDDLPEPIGRQTGEPVNDDIEDLMNIEIDLKSNTINDVLPVPPANASEAVPEEDDSIMSQHVDSGFGGDEAEAAEEAEPTMGDEPTDGMNESFFGLFKKQKKDDGTRMIPKDKLPSTLKSLVTTMNKILIDTVTEKLTEVDDKIKNGLMDAIKGEELAESGIGTACISDGAYEININDAWTGYYRVDNEDKSKIKSAFDAAAEACKDEIKDHPKMSVTVFSDKYNCILYLKLNSDLSDKLKEYVKSPSDNPFTEAITMGDEPAEGTTDPTGDPAPTDAATPDADPGPAEDPGAGDVNSVTAAVMDKVSEADTTPDAEATQAVSKDEILKKLGNLTKNLEDAKRAIMDSLH